MMKFEYLLLITIVYNLDDFIVFYYLFIYFWPLQEASRMLASSLTRDGTHAPYSASLES